MAAILADDIFNCILLNEIDKIPIQMSLKLVPGSPIDNKLAFDQVMALRRTGDSEMTSETNFIYNDTVSESRDMQGSLLQNVYKYALSRIPLHLCCHIFISICGVISWANFGVHNRLHTWILYWLYMLCSHAIPFSGNLSSYRLMMCYNATMIYTPWNSPHFVTLYSLQIGTKWAFLLVVCKTMNINL